MHRAAFVVLDGESVTLEAEWEHPCMLNHIMRRFEKPRIAAIRSTGCSLLRWYYFSTLESRLLELDTTNGRYFLEITSHKKFALPARTRG